MIKITKERLLELLKSELKLNMLDAYGVDNWDGYGDALNPEGEKSYRELAKELMESGS